MSSTDPYRRQRVLWFTAMNGIAILIAAGLFYFVLHGEALDTVFTKLMLGIFEYKLLVVLIAMSPIFASLLVGMAYAQRALKRKRAAQRASAQPATNPVG
jgi:flagellar basal body-associated protein FliL